MPTTFTVRRVDNPEMPHNTLPTLNWAELEDAPFAEVSNSSLRFIYQGVFVTFRRWIWDREAGSSSRLNTPMAAIVYNWSYGHDAGFTSQRIAAEHVDAQWSEARSALCRNPVCDFQ